MHQELLTYLKKITPEEQTLLEEAPTIRREIYTSRRDFVVDSEKMLRKGQLIEVRTHTRFAHFPNHRHNYVELVYMCTGSTTHIIDQAQRIVLRPGDLLFLHQNAYHEILPAGADDVAVNFMILPEFFSSPLSMLEKGNVLRDFLISTLSGESARSGYLHIQAKEIIPVENLIENMIWTLVDKGMNPNTILQKTMGLLFMNLSAFAERFNQGSPGRQEENTVFVVLKYIESHFKDGSLAQISAQLKRPPYSVSRLLKQRTGRSFKELLQQRKLQQAAYLLTATPLSVEAVRNVIGYSNSSYFYRQFRKQYGCSPKEFRAREHI